MKNSTPGAAVSVVNWGVSDLLNGVSSLCRHRWLTSLVLGTGLLLANVAGARAEGSAASATETAPKDELTPDEAVGTEGASSHGGANGETGGELAPSGESPENDPVPEEGHGDVAANEEPSARGRPGDSAANEAPASEEARAEPLLLTNGTSTESITTGETASEGAGAPSFEGVVRSESDRSPSSDNPLQGAAAVSNAKDESSLLTHHARPAEMAPGAGCCQDAVMTDQPRQGVAIDSAQPPGPWGVMLGVGVPDGLMLSGLYRPVEWARVNAGLGHNGVSLGARVGGALVPFGKGPFLGVDLGHYFAGNANNLVRPFVGSDYEDAALLESVGYSYLNLRLGLELGSDRFAFIMRGGFTFLRMALRNIEETVNRDSVTMRVSLREDPVVTAIAPTLDLGFAVYF